VKISWYQDQDQSVINVKEPSQPAALEQQVNSSEAAPWEAYKEQDRYVEPFGIGT